MSEQQNVTLIQRLFEAFGHGDVQTILDSCTKDCEFYCPGPAAIPYSGTKKGVAEIQGYFDALIGTQSDANLSINQFVAQDNNVVAIGRYTATVKATGKRFETPVVLTFQVEGGKVARHMVVGDTAAISASYSGAAAAGR
jgi:ketosteroid isomerase-like protein